MTTTAPAVDLEQMMERLNADVAGVFEQMNIAEEEVEAAQHRHPQHTDRLWHSFTLLRPPEADVENVMAFEPLYRAHVRELLERVAAGRDTRPGTNAEICMACCHVSFATPMNTPAVGLYMRAWRACGLPPMDNGEHYEAIEGSTIDDFEAFTRRQLAVPDRRLPKVIECGGRHNGERVNCRYATHTTPAPTIVAAPVVAPEPAADKRGQLLLDLAA